MKEWSMISVLICVLVACQGFAESFSLKSVKSGKIYGPYKFENGAKVKLGKASFTVVVSSADTESKAKKTTSAAVNKRLKGKTPRQVYAIYKKAIKAGDPDTIMACALLENPDGKPVTKSQLAAALPLMKSMSPADPEILDESIDGNKATLKVKGAVMNPFTKQEAESNGTVIFEKINGVWKIKKESW